MRIISGSFKGKKIFEPKNSLTRPLKDLTKESIFNIIAHSNKLKINLSNALVLDLFSGVGSFGLECLSRGVKEVTFVENYKEVLPILKKNLQNLEVNNYKIIEKDIYNLDTLKKLENKFDIIFLDPPYKYKDIEVLIERIYSNKILNTKGIIIMHRHKKEKDFFPKKINIIEEKKYGISKITFFSF